MIGGTIVRHGSFTASRPERLRRIAKRKAARTARRSERRYGAPCCRGFRPSSWDHLLGDVWQCGECGSRWLLSRRPGERPRWRRKRLPAWQVTL